MDRKFNVMSFTEDGVTKIENKGDVGIDKTYDVKIIVNKLQ